MASSIAAAQGSGVEPGPPVTGVGCPTEFNQEALGSVCVSVSAMSPDRSDRQPYLFKYERQIYEASCVNYETDSEDVRNERVRRMVETFPEEFLCNSIDLGIAGGGNVLKLAVNKSFMEFLDDAGAWGISTINQVDASDNRTVLDYVNDTLQPLNPASSQARTLVRIRRSLIERGAKTRLELEAEAAAAAAGTGN